MKHRDHLQAHVSFAHGRGLETIATRARELWLSCGEPVVRDDAIWQEAERELRTEQSDRARIAAFRRR